MKEPRVRILMTLALALAAGRFVLTPWLDHQNERRDSLEVLTKRLDRSEWVVDSRASIVKEFADLTSILENARIVYPRSVSSSDDRIEVQRRFNQLASESALAITFFDVLLEGQDPQAKLRFMRVQGRLEGPLNGIANFHAKLEGEQLNITIRELRVSPAFPVDRAGDMGSQLSFTADVYFRAIEGQQVRRERDGV